jgi:5-methyltetrahydrofolate--homocysteine methyltransferase
MTRDQELTQAVINGDKDGLVRLLREELGAGRGPLAILNEGLLPGMNILGERFGRGEIFIPELMAAAKAMTAAMELLRPLLEATGVEPLGKVVIGTVKGDMHDIGKNLVAMMLRGAGFEVVDLGVNTSAEKFLQALEETGARLMGMSALLTTTMNRMGGIIQEVRRASFGGEVRIVVGGAPLDEAYARKIGADGYAKDAALAVDRFKALCGGARSGAPGAQGRVAR